jgi:folate-binding protein YgfZ
VENGRLEAEVRALADGRAFVVHVGTRITHVRGRDARPWLQDIVTADLTDLEPFGSRRSLLLTPTGRIRADFHVLGTGGTDDGFLIAQSADQLVAIEDLLAPYVLSSDVVLASTHLALVSVSGDGADPGIARGRRLPSVLGVGFDLVVADGVAGIRRDLEPVGLVEVGPEAVEAWRIHRGIPRFPIDLDEDSLPAEASLDDGVVIDRSKGCFLGQESVAKVRNRGHPTRAVLPMQASGSARAGEAVLAEDAEIGSVTSADTLAGRTSVIVRVRWDARDRELRVASGSRLRPH